MSLTFAGCKDRGVVPGPQVSTLTVSPKVVAVGSVVNISVVVTNPSPYNGTYNATCRIDDASIGSKIVNLTAKANQTVTFNYIPTKEGTFNVTIPLNPFIPSSQLSASFGAVNPPDGYWDILYNVVNGSKVTLNYSLAPIMGLRKTMDLHDGDGIVTLRVNKDVINGTREVILPSAGWQYDPIFVLNMSPGVNMSLVISLTQDARGVLYVQDRVGDVDVSSVSSFVGNQTQVNTYVDGKKNTAGSLLINTSLEGKAYMVQVGKTVDVPLGLTFTTGNITNIVSIPSTKFNGATISSNGTPFARDGAFKVADYVGTAGTITTTGTGYCLELPFGYFTIDLQVEIKLVLEPVSLK
jgi:hypothetical protein